MDPITKGGHENYKRKTSPVVKKGVNEFWHKARDRKQVDEHMYNNWKMRMNNGTDAD